MRSSVAVLTLVAPASIRSPPAKRQLLGQAAERWPDLIDVDAGRIATGQSSVEELFHHYLEAASGKKTWAEAQRIHNDLALFNPAPLT